MIRSQSCIQETCVCAYCVPVLCTALQATCWVTNQGHFLCGTLVGRKEKEKSRNEKNKINQWVISTCNKCLEGKMWGAVIEADGRKRMLYLFVYLFRSCPVACGIFFLQPGIEPVSWQWECQVLTAGHAGNSLEEDALDTGDQGRFPQGGDMWTESWKLWRFFSPSLKQPNIVGLVGFSTNITRFHLDSKILMESTSQDCSKE